VTAALVTVAWVQRASCRGRPLAWWYPERGDAFAVAVAKSICRGCPVRTECLDEALAFEVEGERFGIRGGLTPRDRTQLAGSGSCARSSVRGSFVRFT
jgi:WhiB family redox-sensing transcriptional regulator